MTVKELITIIIIKIFLHIFRKAKRVGEANRKRRVKRRGEKVVGMGRRLVGERLGIPGKRLGGVWAGMKRVAGGLVGIPGEGRKNPEAMTRGEIRGSIVRLKMKTEGTEKESNPVAFRYGVFWSF